MAATSSSTRPRDPGRRVLELRSAGHSSDAIRDQLRTDGYPEATIRNAVPGNQRRRKVVTETPPTEARPFSTPRPDPEPVELEPAPSTPVDEGSSSAGDQEPARPARRSRTMPRLSTPSFGGGGDAAGAVLGVLGMALVVNYMRGGPDQVKAWFRAKFLNDAAGYTSPATKGSANATSVYDVHAAMTRVTYNAAHPSGGGTSYKGGQVKGP